MNENDNRQTIRKIEMLCSQHNADLDDLEFIWADLRKGVKSLIQSNQQGSAAINIYKIKKIEKIKKYKIQIMETKTKDGIHLKEVLALVSSGSVDRQWEVDLERWGH